MFPLEKFGYYGVDKPFPDPPRLIRIKNINGIDFRIIITGLAAFWSARAKADDTAVRRFRHMQNSILFQKSFPAVIGKATRRDSRQKILVDDILIRATPACHVDFGDVLNVDFGCFSYGNIFIEFMYFQCISLKGYLEANLF